MLAKPAEPFDSDQHLFEVKWDGTRCVAFVDRDGLRLVNRRQVDMTYRYPEFARLIGAPPGTVLDGEIVVFDEGKPSFRKLLSRENTSSRRVKDSAAATPAVYIVFDLLYENFNPLLDKPIEERREKLTTLVGDLQIESLILSEAVTGHGKLFYDQVAAQGLEGIVAKRLGSRYLPGKRTDAWQKIKARQTIPCAIIGFVPAEDGSRDFRSLVLAAHRDGKKLKFAGKVGTGFDRKLRDQVNEVLWSRLADEPLVPCAESGKWLESGLYCLVSFLEWTNNSELRDPVFEELIVE